MDHLGIAVCILALGANLLAAIAVGTNRWRYSSPNSIEYGLFEKCKLSSSSEDCSVRIDGKLHTKLYLPR